MEDNASTLELLDRALTEKHSIRQSPDSNSIRFLGEGDITDMMQARTQASEGIMPEYAESPLGSPRYNMPTDGGNIEEIAITGTRTQRMHGNHSSRDRGRGSDRDSRGRPSSALVGKGVMRVYRCV